MMIKSYSHKTVGLCILVIIVFSFNSRVSAQMRFADPRLIVGGSVAQFRVSLDRFEEIYDGRWGLGYGWNSGVRVYSNIYISLSGRYFEKTGRPEGVSGTSGVPLSQAFWKENWYLLGIRRYVLGERKWGSSIGLGYAFFYLEENPEVSVFEVDENGSGKQDGKGFFLSIGIEYSLRSWMGLYGELEITSAGVGGRSGFEGLSIGGFYLAFGTNIRLF